MSRTVIPAALAEDPDGRSDVAPVIPAAVGRDPDGRSDVAPVIPAAVGRDPDGRSVVFGSAPQKQKRMSLREWLIS